jgi:hypothetical protein
MLQAIIAIGLTTSLWVTVALLTSPEDEDTLQRFYLEARPMGAWKQVRHRLSQTGQQVPDEPPGLLIGGLVSAMLGAGSIALAVLGLSQLYVGAYGIAVGLLGGAACCSLAFRAAFNWHMARLDAV